jgi:hypothetical protein
MAQRARRDVQFLRSPCQAEVARRNLEGTQALSGGSGLFMRISQT